MANMLGHLLTGQRQIGDSRILDGQADSFAAELS